MRAEVIPEDKHVVPEYSSRLYDVQVVVREVRSASVNLTKSIRWAFGFSVQYECPISSSD
jgi:hypothetical protein